MLKKSVTAILIVSALIAVACGNLFAAIPVVEREALIALYNSTDGPNWTDSTNWLGEAGTECTWFGVTCDEGNTHVSHINLRGYGLSGKIPSELGNFSDLEKLDLYNNRLTGNIPQEFGKLSNLTWLSLSTNQLTGDIPKELGNLADLSVLALSDNQLTENIPPELANLFGLKWLYLDANQLTGNIPSEFGNLSNLIELNLSKNRLTGNIPAELGNLSHLSSLALFANQLTGDIPPELGNLSDLEYLSLDANRLTGSIPKGLENLAHLSSLYLSDNALTGSIPRELGNLAYLSVLVLSANQLTGDIPRELGNLSRLKLLDVSENRLSGAVPLELVNLPLIDARNDFRRNSLYTSNPALRDFLNLKQIDGDWESYQLLNGGYKASSDLWIRAVIRTVEKGSVNAVWQKGGEGSTSGGDRVIWGYFYASPDDVSWGSVQNPDLFVKIWFDRSGRVDVNFFHVSVPEIEVYSDYPYNGTPDEQSLATMSKRYIRHYYESGRSGVSEQDEDGLPASGYLPANPPSGVMTVNNLKFGSVINTLEKGGIEAVWQLGGQSTTARGDQIVWGYFYADPSDVTWGDKSNPDLFVKIWYDVSGRVDVNFFHVSVPDIEVYSDCIVNKVYDNKGTTVLNDRYIRHEYNGICASDPSNSRPVAKFYFSFREAPLTVTFSDNSSNAVSWLWDFGDGENSSVRSPVHIYSNAGTYTVRLVVKGAGGTDFTTAIIKVTDPVTDPEGGSGGW